MDSGSERLPMGGMQTLPGRDAFGVPRSGYARFCRRFNEWSFTNRFNGFALQRITFSLVHLSPKMSLKSLRLYSVAALDKWLS